MDPNTLFLLIIGGASGFAALRRFWPGRAAAAPGVDQRGAPVAHNGAPDQDAAPIGMRQWLTYVNYQPDRVPHLAIIGPSGAGKTTLATAVLADRAGRIVVITAKEGDHWGGLPYVGIDEDATYTTARATFAALEHEVKRRLVAVKKHGGTTDDYMTIVVDDFSTLVKEAPVAADVVKLVARLGRSLRVRLVMLSDSALVKAIGLEGEGETRSNFAFLRIARGHKSVIEIEGEQRPIDTSKVRQAAQQAHLADRAWRPRRSPDDELEERQRAWPDEPLVRGTAARIEHSEAVYRYTGDVPAPRTSSVPPTDGLSDVVIRALIQAGWSRNKICEQMRSGNKQARLERIEQALEGHLNEQPT